MTTTSRSEPVNCGVQRWTIDAPSSDQYEKDDEGAWVEWDDVAALLWERDEARTEADTLRAELAACKAVRARLEQRIEQQRAANRGLQRFAAQHAHCMHTTVADTCPSVCAKCGAEVP